MSESSGSLKKYARRWGNQFEKAYTDEEIERLGMGIGFAEYFGRHGDRKTVITISK